MLLKLRMLLLHGSHASLRGQVSRAALSLPDDAFVMRFSRKGKTVSQIRIAAVVFALGCHNLGSIPAEPAESMPEECMILAMVADSLSGRITETANGDKSGLIAAYASVVTDLSEFGCPVVPSVYVSTSPYGQRSEIGRTSTCSHT